MQRRDLTYELVTSIAQQYSSRFEFQKGDKAAYNKALKEGWIDLYTWFTTPVRTSNDRMSKVHVVYAYLDEVNKVAYIGRTINIRRRHSQHNRLSSKYGTYDIVKKYFMSIGMVDHLPEPIVIEEGLTLIESQEKEDFYVNEYRRNGWQILNTGKTGANISSVGSYIIKWTYESCKALALTCKSRKEFGRRSSAAYALAREKGWIDEWLPVSPNYTKAEYSWTKEMCVEIAKKYTSLPEFTKQESRAYTAARRNGWLKDFHWLKRGKRENITEDEIRHIAKKYDYVSDFKRDYPYHYNRARRMGLLKELDFTPKKPITWNYERCYAEASKYSCLADFHKACPAAYRMCQMKGWVDKWFLNAPDYQKSDYLRLKELCLEKSKKYTTLKEFAGKESKFYYAAKRNGWLVDMLWLKNTRITKDDVFQKAQNCMYASDFKRNYPSYYNFARTTGILKYLGFKPKDTRKWTYEACRAESSKFSCQIEFRKACPIAYNVSLRNGWINDWLPKTIIIRTDEELLNEAKNFKTINELRKKNDSFYCLLLKRGLLERTGLQYLRKQWNDEKVKEEAALYKTRNEFLKGSNGAYRYAKKHDMLDELFPKQ